MIYNIELVTQLTVLFAGSLGKNVKVRLAGPLSPLHCLDGSDGEIFVLNLISRLAARSGLLKCFLFSLWESLCENCLTRSSG